MLKVFGYKCFYTGQNVTEDNCAIDHVIPKSKGGEDSVFNYVLTTRHINGRKTNKLDEEKVKNILYLVRTVYAPRVLRILKAKKEPCFQVPVRVFERFKDLNHSALYVYLILIKLSEKADAKGSFRLSYKPFAQYGIARTSFDRVIVLLIENKFIRVDGNQRSKICKIIS